jgi:GMP reductase
MAGNVCTKEMTQELIMNGADIVKVGIGPGSACTTTRKTGVGMPQLSAILECADVAHGLGGHICGDGGCKEEKDICKAIGAGADFVMLGGMLAGTDECEGSWVHDTDMTRLGPITGGKRIFRYFGMSSYAAQDMFSGAIKDYAAEEGTTIEVPYKGSIHKVMKEIMGSLRSYCAYVGAKKIKDAPKCTTFVRVR